MKLSGEMQSADIVSALLCGACLNTIMAERLGFEPRSELPRYSISSAAPSTNSDIAPQAFMIPQPLQNGQQLQENLVTNW